MRALGGVESKRASDVAQRAAGDAYWPPLLEPRVPRHADAGVDRNLLASQARGTTTRLGVRRARLGAITHASQERPERARR
jgi:hypothetical protein